MASIVINKEEFADIVISFLLDNLVKDDITIDNDEFDIIMDKIEKCGIKTHLTYAFINTDLSTRVKYKQIRKAFTDKSSGRYNITITNKKEKKALPKEKETILKTIVKKSLKMIKNHKRYHGQLITEETVDRIIDKAIKENM